ncbi:MAG TPA: hypothetical protein VH309_04060, partial [Elusimicrobiota bacterium]|nr:hypothetical protein [Elusimicrobiota bacterium]
RTFTLAGVKLSWRDPEGRVALNRGGNLSRLDRLNVNFQWTGRQLVSRLEAETPVAGETRLTTARLYGKTWGVLAGAGNGAFNLAAPFSSRSESIAWQSTARCRDLELRVAADALFGDLWIYLRYDRTARRGVRIGFTPGLVLAEEWRDGDWKRLGSFPRAAVSGGPLHSTIRLEGARLDVASDDGTRRGFDLAPEPAPRPGLIMLQSYDKVRGVAGVRSMILALKPS